MEKVNLLQGFDGPGWSIWSAAENRTPVFSLGEKAGITADRFEHYGKLCYTARNLTPGETYAFTVAYTHDAGMAMKVCIGAVLTWYAAEGEGDNMISRHYAENIRENATDETVTGQLSFVCEAPKDVAKPFVYRPLHAETLHIELFLKNCKSGSVTFSNPSLTVTTPVPHRKVKVVTTWFNHTANTERTLAKSMERLLLTADKAGREKPDIVIFPETMIDRGLDLGTGRYMKIPCEYTEKMAHKAREYNCYMLFSLHEEGEEGFYYNTAILMDRHGEIVGKYRKTHLSMEEAEMGLTAGNALPVFETDFGKIGILICWDLYFAAPAAILAQKGAEIICVSTAGDAHIQTYARAADNGVYAAIAGYGRNEHATIPPSRIIDPNGNVMCAVEDDMGIACATIDLDKMISRYWLSVGDGYGECKNIYQNEMRLDLYAESLKGI